MTEATIKVTSPLITQAKNLGIPVEKLLQEKLITLTEKELQPLLDEHNIGVSSTGYVPSWVEAKPVHEAIAEISAQVPAEEWDKLPTDLARNLNYYTELGIREEPTPGQIYRHRNPDPVTGKWYEYVVVGIVQPFPETPGENIRTSFLLPTIYRHTETEHKHVLTGCGTKIFAHDIEEAHIAYKSTRPELCDPDWTHCLRSLSEFMDGRFELVDPMQELVDQAQELGLGYE